MKLSVEIVHSQDKEELLRVARTGRLVYIKFVNFDGVLCCWLPEDSDVFYCCGGEHRDYYLEIDRVHYWLDSRVDVSGLTDQISELERKIEKLKSDVQQACPDNIVDWD